LRGSQVALVELKTAKDEREMKLINPILMLLALGFTAVAHANPVCTAVSTVNGNIELKSKPYNFDGKIGTEFNVNDQRKDPYALSIVIFQNSDVEVILTDLGATNQSSGFDGGFSSSGKIAGTILIRHSNGDDIVEVDCQK
jgi:hypothetical protein